MPFNHLHTVDRIMKRIYSVEVVIRDVLIDMDNASEQSNHVLDTYPITEFDSLEHARAFTRSLRADVHRTSAHTDCRTG